jgi:hypothetical protein
MNKEDTIIDEIPAEKDDFYSDDDLYNINSWGADLSFRELIDRYDDNELVKPEMQRNYVWDKSEASRFIDSILLGLPIPSIFLAKTKNEKMLIIDGYQRIMTVRDYVRGIFSTDSKVFRLTKSNKVNPRWQGKAFSELTETEQRKIKNTTIHSIIFVQAHPSDDDTSLYQVFERINTSGRTLLPQEIRNCVYQGPFNSLLIELNKDSKWRTLYGLHNADSRMRDIEFILRFFALKSIDLINEQSQAISLKRFLNTFMGLKESNLPNILSKRKDIFLQTVPFIVEHFGQEAFHNISQKYPDKLVLKFNPTIFDSMTLATAYALENKKTIPKYNFKEKRKELLRNESYQNAISTRTTNISSIKTRVSLALKYLYGINYE